MIGYLEGRVVSLLRENQALLMLCTLARETVRRGPPLAQPQEV